MMEHESAFLTGLSLAWVMGGQNFDKPESEPRGRLRIDATTSAQVSYDCDLRKVGT
jgi:hypothetical protein